ncbi:MAG: PAS domain S-box protein [Anaerolineae bacterium]|nr:PAS domain S-box protein [Anaerolineae bacterium]
MDITRSNSLFLNIASTHANPILEYLRDTAKIEFVDRQAATPNCIEAALREQHWDLILFNSAQADSLLSKSIQLANRLQPQVPLLVTLETATLKDAVDLMRKGVRGVAEHGDHCHLIELIQQELNSHYSAAKDPNTLEIAVQDALATAPESILPKSQHGLLPAQMNAAVIVTDMSLQIQSWNQAAERIYGWSESEVLGRSSSMILGTVLDSADEFQQIMETTQAGHWWQGAFTQHHKDGSQLRIRGSLRLIRDEAGQPMGMVSVHQNITDREQFKQTEAALRESEARYRLLAENITEAIAKITPDGIRTFVTASCFPLLGYTPDELLERPVMEIIHPDDRPHSHAMVQQAIASGATSFTNLHRVLRKDGSTIWVEISGSIVRDPISNQPIEIISIMRDITQRKLAEDTLRESEARYRLLAENIKDVIARITPDGIRTFVTPSCFPLLGYRPDELVGKPGFDLLVPEDRPISQAALQNALKSGADTFRVEHRLLHKDGYPIWVELSASIVRDALGKPIEVIGIIHEITQRKQAENALRESEARYRLLAENIQDVITVVSAEGIYTFITPSCQRLLGYAPEELIGQPGFLIIHPDDWHKARSSLQEALHSSDDTSTLDYTLERRLLHKDGHAIWVEVKSTIVRDSISGRPIEFISVIRDIRERKQAEEAREQYVAEIHDLYNNAPCGYHSLNAEGVVVQINDTELKWLGYSREEVVGKLRAVDLLTTESIAAFRANFPVLKETGSLTGIELELKRKDGSLFTVLVNVTAVYDDSGAFVKSRSTLFDITELKKSQNALKESEQLYRTLISTMTEGIVLQAQDSTILTCNAAAEQILGLTHDQLVGRTSLDPRWRTFHEDGTPFRRETHPAMVTLATGKAQTNVVIGVHKPDGSLRWIQVSNQPLFEPGQTLPRAVVSTFTDITERKQAEVELQTLSKRLQLATEVGNIGIWDWDLQTDDMIWDDQMFRLYGLKREAFSVKARDTWNLGLLHPDDVSRMEHEIQMALVEQKPIDSEFRINRPDGQLRHLKLKAIVFHNSSGQPTRMLGVLWDITVLKQAEEGLRMALEKEKEIGELKSRFISTASHEFRTPLAVILAATETLTVYRTQMDDAQVNKRLDKIRLQVKAMAEIMDDVLQLARFQAKRIEFRPVDSDLKSFCQDILEEYQSRPEYRERIVFSAPEGPVMLCMDVNLMRRIIGNLVSNALKYSPPDAAVQLTLSRDAKHVTCQISDQGIGIPPDDLKHLFEPFHRAANVGTIGGTGLGLSIAREAVLTHGGTIEVESEVGQGTTFTVVLPFIPHENLTTD